MALSLAEIKELITFGQEIGLAQMSAAGVAVVYGHPGATQAPFTPGTAQDDTADILAHYSAVGRSQLKSRTNT